MYAVVQIGSRILRSACGTNLRVPPFVWAWTRGAALAIVAVARLPARKDRRFMGCPPLFRVWYSTRRERGRERAMDFEVTYTGEQQRFRNEVRTWFDANVPKDRTYPALRDFGRKLGAKGWLYSTAPAAYGGGGLDVDHAIILEEEADRLDLSLPPYYDSGGRLGSASILVWGTEEQRQMYLPPIYRGEVRTWQLLTEPGAGSDLASVSMTVA